MVHIDISIAKIIFMHYAYGPFGEVVRASGAMAGVNPFQFSTTYTDSETGLNYYGYRYYNASTGRWIGRDPAGENGGLNLYAFVENDPIIETDHHGNEWEWNIQDHDIQLFYYNLLDSLEIPQNYLDSKHTGSL
jgi:RHS repeat-associated protein